MKNLSPRTQGILWELHAAVAFVCLTSLVKFVSTALPTPLIACLRTYLSLFFVVPLALSKGIKKPQKASLPWYLLRTVMATATINAIFYGYKHLPLSVAMVIGYTEPMIQVIFSVFFFRAVVTMRQWLLILLAYCGVFFIAYTKYDPEKSIMTTAIFVVLLASIFISMVKVATKYLTQREAPHQVIFYSTLLNIASSSFVVYGTSSFWPETSPPRLVVVLLPLIGLFGFLTQYSLTKALSLAEMHVLSPVAYLRLILAIPIGYCCYGETLSWTTLLGSVIILCCNYILLLPQKRAQA